MFFLIRTAFWFSLVLLVLPLGSADPENPAVSPVQALLAAREAAIDIAGFCERQPDVCETGSAAFHTISVRAREGVRIAGEMMETDAPVEAAAAQAIEAELDQSIHTGGIPLPRFRDQTVN